MKCVISIMVNCSLWFLLLQDSNARNLSRRPGIGYQNQMARTETSTIPAASFRYHFSERFGVNLALGFDTRQEENTFAIGTKLFSILFAEDFLNFYWGGGIAVISYQESAFQGSLFLGSEFFFSGLPSLGFSFETGIRADKTTGTLGITTFGDSFIAAGIHFYI